jgi:hypothetical protein
MHERPLKGEGLPDFQEVRLWLRINLIVVLCSRYAVYLNDDKQAKYCESSIETMSIKILRTPT